MEVADCIIWAQEDGIVIEGSLLRDKKNSSKAWALRELGDEHFIIHTVGEKTQSEPKSELFASYGIDIFADFLLALHERQWSGVVIVSLNECEKKIYLRNGEIVFAASSLVDDRLGEVIYREGIISIDAWIEGAAKVTRLTKFGQALLGNGILKKQELWDMLKLQVIEIVRSIFLVERVFVRLQENARPPTMIFFDSSSRFLIEESLCYGLVYRDFSSRVSPDAEMVTLTSSGDSTKAVGNDFYKDLLQIISEHGKYSEILASSKLCAPYTSLMLLRLIHAEFCTVKLEKPPEIDGTLKPETTHLINQVKIYNLVAENAKQVCEREKKDLPVEELKRFVLSIDSKNFRNLVLNDDGLINVESMHSMSIQCEYRISRAKYFVKNIEVLTMFLLQIIGDTISFSAIKEVRGSFI